MAQLDGKLVAILCTDGVEEAEALEPMKALLAAGAEVEVIAPEKNEVQGYVFDKPGQKIEVHTQLADADPYDYDAIVLPGGVANPDTLRINEEAIAFIHAFVVTGKPIAAICHGPWTLIEAGGVKGRKMTSWPSLRTDLRNAGAVWADASVIVDGNLVTSRKPDDLPDFNRELIRVIENGPVDLIDIDLSGESVARGLQI